MPINYVFSPPLNGSSGDDYILGVNEATPNNTINGNDGDDLIVGDVTDAYVLSSTFHNGTTATAWSIDGAGQWFTDENPFFADSSIPHTSVYAEATVGEAEVYSLTLGAGETVTADLDFGNGSPIGDSLDMKIEILDSMGNVVASNDDSSSSADGGLGSVSFRDPLTSYTSAAGGTYYIRVTPWYATTFDLAATFVLNVSATGHATSPATQANGNDIIDAGAGDDTVAGQGGNDTINGGDGNDTLIGGSGLDTINGGIGNDIIYGSNSATDWADDDEQVHGDDGNDTIYSTGTGHYYGDAGNDYIYAGLTGSGLEYLDGGAGIDTLDTRSWNGTYSVNLSTGATNYNETFLNFEDLYTGNGNDTVIGTSAVNNIYTNGGSDNIGAGSGNDYINAGEGNNFLNGGAGADTMVAGTGNDTYVVDNVGDTISDAGGVDTVRSLITYTLGTGLENLTLIGNAVINGTGNDGNNIILGNSSANILDGGLGADSMRGGGGDDVYYVDNSGDRAIETASASGYDTVYSSVSFLLGTNVERLDLTGLGAISGTGNASANLINGNAAANTIAGRAGNDTLYGNGGDDRLYGESGDDYLFGNDGTDFIAGGTGVDQLFGGAGADNFVFFDGDMGNGSAAGDRIRDFSHAEGDRIRLNYSDANTTVAGDQAYSFIGTGAFTHHAGELRYEQISGNTYVYGDQDGDGNADWIIRVDGLHTLVSGDFVL